MKQASIRRLSVLGYGLALASLAAACTGSVGGDNPAGNAGSGTGVGGGSGGAGSMGGSGSFSGSGMIQAGNGTTIACEGSTVTGSKRIVRLSFHQISRTLHALLGDTFGQQVDAENEIGSEAQVARTFPPLASPREGGVISETLWPKNDLIAQEAGKYALANLATVTACTATPTDECGQTFVKTFAEKAYRRPLTAEESTSILQVYSEVKTIYGTVPEAIQHAVYAIVEAPQVLYRTELGTSAAEAGALTPSELASQLSYFLTDGPPDQPLLDAAKAGQLATPAELRTQAARILSTPTARKNLEEAMFSYFKVDNLATVKIDDPAFTSGTAQKPYTGLRESFYRETELFLANTLWSGPLTGLLTNNKSSVNTTLAAFYGLTLPNQPADENTFVEVTLPAGRGGILTQPGFLASRSRPDVGSVVARGIVVNSAMLCTESVPPPTDPTTQAAIADAKAKLANATQREQADFRMKTPPCLGCHLNFDAYGLALDTFDSFGRYRTMDPEGRPIDPSVTLPGAVGGQLAKDAMDMQAQLSNAPGFTNCVSKNMLNWAFAEGSSLSPESCAAKSVSLAYSGGDKTFSSLLSEIAASEGFINRNAGAM